MNQKSIEHIALYSLVLVGTLVVGVLARQFVLSKGVDDFSSSVAFFASENDVIVTIRQNLLQFVSTACFTARFFHTLTDGF